MRFIPSLVIGSALLLAACGDNDQQAQRNTPDTTGSVAQPNEAQGSGGNLPASAPGAGAATLAGRSFTTASGTLEFMADNRFAWRDQQGRTMTGRYVQETERIAFNDVQGGEAGASIPMACRYRMDGPNRFTIDASGTTCPVFRGLAFQARE